MCLLCCCCLVLFLRADLHGCLQSSLDRMSLLMLTSNWLYDCTQQRVLRQTDDGMKLYLLSFVCKSQQTNISLLATDIQSICDTLHRKRHFAVQVQDADTSGQKIKVFFFFFFFLPFPLSILFTISSKVPNCYKDVILKA